VVEGDDRIRELLLEQQEHVLVDPLRLLEQFGCLDEPDEADVCVLVDRQFHLL